MYLVYYDSALSSSPATISQLLTGWIEEYVSLGETERTITHK